MSKELEDLKVEDMTHGLIAVDPEMYDEENDTIEILHFCGYWSEPAPEEVENLRNELATDEEFGLTEIADRLDIFEAPEEIVKHFREMGME